VLRRIEIERNPRIQAQAQIVIRHHDQELVAMVEDMSERGVFAHTDRPLLRGSIVDIEVPVAQDRSLRLKARVAHVLEPAAAAVLGRTPGVGFRFMFDDGESRMHWLDHVASLERDVKKSRAQTNSAAGRILIADPHEGMRNRLKRGLETLTSMAIETVDSGGEAFIAALDSPPDVLVAAAELEGHDGIELLKRMREHFQLKDVPYVLTVMQENHLLRLEAFRHGAADVIGKPFTDEELALRVQRLVIPSRSGGAEPNLRGQLGELSLGTLLSLFDIERKSGIVSLIRGQSLARLHISEGRVVRISGPSAEGTPVARAMKVLDWTSASFDFVPATIEGEDELGLSTQQLLLEHARIRDEE